MNRDEQWPRQWLIDALVEEQHRPVPPAIKRDRDGRARLREATIALTGKEPEIE